MAKPENIDSIKPSDRTNDKMTELFALWQRDYPDGVGKNATLTIKDERVGNKALWELKGKIGQRIFYGIIISIEKYYNELVEEHGNN